MEEGGRDTQGETKSVPDTAQSTAPAARRSRRRGRSWWFHSFDAAWGRERGRPGGGRGEGGGGQGDGPRSGGCGPTGADDNAWVDPFCARQDTTPPRWRDRRMDTKATASVCLGGEVLRICDLGHRPFQKVSRPGLKVGPQGLVAVVALAKAHRTGHLQRRADVWGSPSIPHVQNRTISCKSQTRRCFTTAKGINFTHPFVAHVTSRTRFNRRLNRCVGDGFNSRWLRQRRTSDQSRVDGRERMGPLLIHGFGAVATHARREKRRNWAMHVTS